MFGLAAAVGAAVLAQASPQVEALVRAFQDGQAIQLSFSEMASVTSAPLAGPVKGRFSTEPLRLEGAAYAFETGVRNIALSRGVGSNSQAATDIRIQVALPRLAD